MLIFGLLAALIAALSLLARLSILQLGLGREWLLLATALAFALIGAAVSFAFRRKPETTPARSEGKPKNAPESFGISPREFEVLLEIKKGLSNKEIAEKLFISETTVKTHVSSLLQKLDAKRRTQAVQIAIEKRLI
ncbi:MAG: response regulator transcription factor [Bacteroidetes bacterium]|nr:response regulator transcription factor [Bacteroidota bacterium]